MINGYFTHAAIITDNKPVFEKEFANNKTVLEKTVFKQTSQIGAFTVFDFSEIKTPGNYKILYGNIETKPFPVNNNIWLSGIEKSVNLLFGERCGYEVPGIHPACHTDWYTVVDGDTLNSAGGWHDAGDLSQGSDNTGDATQVLFRLARKYEKTNPQLSKRLLDEGLWGLDWLQRTRFPKGQSLYWTRIDNWTDGKIGTIDDIVGRPEDAGWALSVMANVEAALALKNINPVLAEKSKQIDIQDWSYFLKRNKKVYADSLGRAVYAGTRLYELTRDEQIKKQTINLADKLISLQQLEPMRWTIPLNGFFYMNTDRKSVFSYNHEFLVASPIAGLVELCKLFPKDEKYHKWFSAVKLHANYLKTIAQVTAPYHMVPAGIFKVGTFVGFERVRQDDADAQIKNGLKLDEQFYLRNFPVWSQARGNNPNVLSWGYALAVANQLLKDPEIKYLAQTQLEWVVGKNPFGQSQVYGEIFCNYKGVWVHCTARFFQLIDSLEE